MSFVFTGRAFVNLLSRQCAATSRDNYLQWFVGSFGLALYPYLKRYAYPNLVPRVSKLPTQKGAREERPWFRLVTWWQIYLHGWGPNLSDCCRRCCLLPTKPGLCAAMESFFSRLLWCGEMKIPVIRLCLSLQIWRFGFHFARRTHDGWRKPLIIMVVTFPTVCICRCGTLNFLRNL